jgi:FtsZ-binding cell division protein ZapB
MDATALEVVLLCKSKEYSHKQDEVTREVHHIVSELGHLHESLRKLQDDEDALIYLPPLQQKLQELDNERCELDASDGNNVGRPVLSHQPETILDELNACYRLVEEIQYKHNSLSKELSNIKRELTRLVERPSLTLMDVMPYQNRLRSLESKRIDGTILTNPSGKIEPNQAELNKILAECHRLKEKVLKRIK